MNSRSAFTVMEVTIAIILLTFAVVAVGKFLAAVKQGLQDRAVSCQIGWELENLRERVSSWSPHEVTAERIASIPLSDVLSSKLKDSRWIAQVQLIDNPIRARQVSVVLQCELNGQLAEPEKLTFWVLGDDDGF